MTINGILAGLVAITCGCDQYTPLTACLIGIFAGVFSIIAIQFVDKVLKIDDPVGAIGVHGFCGILGTLLAGLFSKTKGLFYTGNADFFLTQLLGSAVVVVFVLVIMGLAFTLIKHTSGLRVSAAEEIEGLDNREHGWVTSISVGGMTKANGKTIDGRTIREKVLGYSLKSAAFDLKYDKNSDKFIFTTYGHGHGVEMSQYGAKALAENGYTYKQILQHYFTGVEIH